MVTSSGFELQQTTIARLSAALDLAPPAEADRLYVPPGEGQAPVRRILVLVPQDAGLDAELAQRAWRLASPAGLPVVLVGLAHDSASEAQRRRQLASLAALTRDEKVAVTITLALEAGWLPAVRRLWRPGDLVVCFAGQMAPSGWLGLRRRPLHEALRARLHAPYYRAQLSSEALAARRAAGRLAQVMALAAALGIIVGFFWLQMQIELLVQGVAQSVLLLLSVFAEFALIAVAGRTLRAGPE